MATPAASLTALPPTAPADASPTTTRTQSTGTPGEFQAALNAAGQSAQATPAADATDAANDLPNDADADDTVNGLIGLVNQFQFLNPAPNAAVAQANGTEIPAGVAAPATDDARARADELLLNRAGGPVPDRNAVPQPNPPATNRAANAAPVTPAPVEPRAAPAVPPAPDGPGEIAIRAANTVAVRGGLPNIPPPAPIVANLLPPQTLPADLTARELVVNGTIEAVPTSGLPAATLGDRPAMEGEKFAAIASAGAHVAATAPQPPASGIFENVLDEVAAAPAPATTVPPSAAASTPPTALTAEAVAAPPNLLDARFSGLGTVNAEPLPPEANVTGASAAPNPFATPAAYNQPSPAPAAASPTAPAAPAPTTAAAAQVADAMVEQARILERPGAVEFQMRLDPPELGRVQIRLVTRGDEVHGQVLVAHDAVRQLLESQLPELRQRLEAAGVNVQQFNIATDTSGGGNRNPYRDAAEEFGPRAARAESAAPLQARIGRADAGSLDVTV